MIHSFKSYLMEESRTVYFTFGRLNPPTIGHQKLMDKLSSEASGNPYRVYVSQSTDPKKNPLEYSTKVKFARKMFPKHARNIILNKNMKTLFDIATSLYNEGFMNIVMVVGSDRVGEFKTLLNKYNGVKGRHGFYNFKNIEVVSAGERDPDAEGVEGMSASKMRAAAESNNFLKFSQGLPKSLSNKDSRELFNAVRKGMGLDEIKEFHNKIQLDPVSETREAYISGDLYGVGDLVLVKESDEIAKVEFCGTNYLILEAYDGRKIRKWIDDVSLLEKKKDDEDDTEVAQDPDIAGRKGSQPATFHKGIKTKSTKVARDREFQKRMKMADDDPRAYKPAPGDATAKTKPSQYTKKFKRMYGEGNAVDAARQRIEREKRSDAAKHDRMLDRARLIDTKRKNSQTS